MAFIDGMLLEIAGRAGEVHGILQGLPQAMQTEIIIQEMVSEAIKTSEIEGEYFNRQDVASSIRNHLALNEKWEHVKDKKAAAIGTLMVAVRKNYNEHLTEAILLEWHSLLMQGYHGINAGVWRSQDEPMQVVSGAVGKEKIHFEAPPSSQVAAEMTKFISWFNNTAPGAKEEIKSATVRAGIAHVYFESIHPFEDGNGRIGRAVAEKAMAQTMKRPVLLSLSKAIESNRKSYYQALETAQKSLDINKWLIYFTGMVMTAQEQAAELLAFVLKKSAFFHRFREQLNERQYKVVQRMMEAGSAGFEGGMSAKKYMSITHASKATATRDLQELQEIGVLLTSGSGRSTHYALNL